MKNTKILFVAAAMLVCSTLSAGAATVYSEDFNSGTTSGWTSYMTNSWTVANNAYQIDAFGGGAPFWSLRNDVLMPSDWTFSTEASYVSSHNGNDPQYGNAGLLLSSTNGPANNPLSGDWVTAVATRSTYQGNIFIGMFLDAKIGGVSSHQFVYCNTALLPTDLGPYFITATRAQGSNDIVATLNMPAVNWTGTLTKSLSGAEVANLKYAGLTSYYSKWQFDNVNITTTAVPEPASLIGLVTGLAGLLAAAMRKR